jgi:hypothetical protein
MIRKSKFQLMAGSVVAVAGIVAFIVSSAGAHTPAKFEFPGGGNTAIHSKTDGNHEIDIPGWGTLVCKFVDFTGTVTGASATSIALKPTFEECAIGEEPVNIDAKACVFVLKADGGLSIATGAKGNCELEPITGILVNALCELTIPPQELTGIGYTNINKEEEITFSMTITKLQGIREGCAPEGAFNSGQYTTGNTILQGFKDLEVGSKPIKWVATVP